MDRLLIKWLDVIHNVVDSDAVYLCVNTHTPPCAGEACKARSATDCGSLFFLISRLMFVCLLALI